MVPSINRGCPTSSLCMRYTVWPVLYSPIQKWNTLQSCTLVGLEMEHSICSTWFYSCRQIYVHINLIHRVIDNVRIIFMLYHWLCNVFFIFCVQTSEEEKFDEDVQAAWEAYLLQLQDASEFVNTQTPLMTQKLEDKYQVQISGLLQISDIKISSKCDRLKIYSEFFHTRPIKPSLQMYKISLESTILKPFLW